VEIYALRISLCFAQIRALFSVRFDGVRRVAWARVVRGLF